MSGGGAAGAATGGGGDAGAGSEGGSTSGGSSSGGAAGSTSGGGAGNGGCVRPTADNTGPTGALGAYDGPSTITKAGAVYENFEYSGTINIEADDVTLRNFRIDGRRGSPKPSSTSLS
jgi:hypothetical protein